MYRRIVAGYQIRNIVSDLRIIFFIHEQVRTVRNILVASATNVKFPWGCHGKIKLLEFSVKSLWMPGVIKRPARDACLCMGELQAPPAPAAPPAPHFVFLITL